jgi:hypothetical protein
VSSLADVSAVWSPSVPRAEEDPVWAFFERLAVVRARGWGLGALGSLLVDGFSDDGEELFPGDDATSSTRAGAGAVAATLALLGPPWRVTFGMGSPCSTEAVAWQCGQHGAPTA